MPIDFQVTVDAADPHPLADWWAETLGWQVEPSDEQFIRRMVAEGHAPESATRDYRGSLVWVEGAAIVHPESGRRVLFQLVGEPKAGKNRVHLDLRPGREQAAALVESLLARGATFLHDGRQGPHTWVTLADPEGNEFCVG